jgi:sodium/hydrogen antiporter
MEWAVALVALALLGVAAISRRLSGTPITPAMLFVAFGLLVGPKVLDGIDVSSKGATVRTGAEATLALVLFCDASRIDLGQLRRTVGVPLRLLAIGLPLTILLGAIVAALVLGELSIEEAVILESCWRLRTPRSGKSWSPSRGCRSASARGSTWRAASTTGSACRCCSRP